MIKKLYLSHNVTRFRITIVFFITCLVAVGAHASAPLDYGSSIDVLIRNLPQEMIKGKVSDSKGVSLPGATVLVKGTTKGVSTDINGNYEITARKGDILHFSYLGFKDKDIIIGESNTINVTLDDDAASLDEIVIVSFGKQKKQSVISSITTINPAALKVASSNLTTALAGRVAGLISYQRSGEPGQDNASFFIRGVTSFGSAGSLPLILIDGIELQVQDLARLNTDDIASFSILKDASATALYGARGANGIVYVTTKEGTEGPVRLSARFESSFSSSTEDIELADPITYMKLFNEAVSTRDPLSSVPFSQQKIENTLLGNNPLLYPSVDWQKELFRDFAVNKRFNLNVNGGGKTARYFVSLGLSQDTGILSVPKVSDFNNNINLKKFQLRSNTNINLTSTTELRLAFNAAFDNYNGPRQGGAEIYSRVLRTSPVLFQPFYEADEGTKFVKHIIFGNAKGPDGVNYYSNPYADLVTGYKEDTNASIIAQIRLDQDLKFITEGLSANMMVNTTRRSDYSVVRGYKPFYYQPFQNRDTKEISLLALNPEDGRNTLDFESNPSSVDASTYFEVDVNYAKNINEKHDVTGLLVATLNNRVQSVTDNNLEASLPFRNQGLSGRFTYAYDKRYFTEFNFGYNGSERFSKSERFGFFPSIAVGWVASSESFLKDVDYLSNLKFKLSYGLVGNDRIGNDADRFFYLSRVSLLNPNMGYTTGQDFTKFLPGFSIDRYDNDKITWETAKKLNFGIELGLFKGALTLEADYFSENRSNILFNRIIPVSLGLQAPVKANVGEAKSSGIDGSLVYKTDFTKDFWLQFRSNFTYATSEITKIEEPDYSKTPWRSAVGKPIGQPFGYIAERLFIDDDEVLNSPLQFGNYSGGDIKYKDIDGNGVINDLDKVPIGKPSTPEIVYGFGFSTGYKGFDLSAFFQGSANSSFFIDTQRANPFVSYGGGVTNNQLLQVWADSHWSEQNRDIYAKWPRLSANNNIIDNNLQTSTWFINNGLFLRLKSIEIGYTCPKTFQDNMGIQNLRIYFSGTNLMHFSKFKYWDPELAGNGFGYPLQKVFNLGLSVSL